MKLDIYSVNGSTTGKSVDLPDSVFSVEPNEHAVYLAVKQYNAAQRQGTHKAKEKGEITASTRKIKKQKGTGTARAGSIKSGLFRGGGRIFGPRPRKYDIKLNKKVKQLARASALSHKAANGNVRVVSDLKLDSINTKNFVNILKDLGIDNEKSLIVLAEYNKELLLSSRNVKTTNVVTVSDLNTYDILNSKHVVMDTEAVSKIEEMFA